MWQASHCWQGFCHSVLLDPDFLLPPGGQPGGVENSKQHLLSCFVLFFNQSGDSNHLNELILLHARHG